MSRSDFDRARELYGDASPKSEAGSVRETKIDRRLSERFPTPTEVWLAKKLGLRHRLFEGVTTPEIRRERAAKETFRMTFHVQQPERYMTEEGCLVESRRHTNAHGLEIESVVLSVPDPQPTTPEDTSAHDH